MITKSVKGSELLPQGPAEAIRANRLPLALMTAGFAWLLASNLASGRGKAEDGTPPAPVRDAGVSTRDRVAPYAEYAEDAKNRARRASGSMRATFERNPLLIGLVGLISGAAIAALLPAARREQEWVDKTRDEMWKKAEEIGHEAADRIRNLAEHKARAT
jgi:hypothetical protein